MASSSKEAIVIEYRGVVIKPRVNNRPGVNMYIGDECIGGAKTAADAVDLLDEIQRINELASS